MGTFWNKLTSPFFVQAPLEDVSDTVFRQMLLECGRPDVFFTEFTSSDAISSLGKKIALQRLQFSQTERPIVGQIWGNNPENYIKTIGLYNTKAANIIKTCQIILEKHQGEVPNNREDLEALPGVGRKTANVLLNTAFGKPVIAVDTHIFRVANRTGLANGNTPLAVETQLTAIIPEEFKHNAHHWLILHGRYICTARKPRCPTCLIRDLCEYAHKPV